MWVYLFVLTIALVGTVIFLKNIRDTKRQLRSINYDATYTSLSSGLDLPPEDLVKKIKSSQIVNYICYYWTLMLIVMSVIGLVMDYYKKGGFQW